MESTNHSLLSTYAKRSKSVNRGDESVNHAWLFSGETENTGKEASRWTHRTNYRCSPRREAENEINRKYLVGLGLYCEITKGEGRTMVLTTGAYRFGGK